MQKFFVAMCVLSMAAGAARADTVAVYSNAVAFKAQAGDGLTAILFDDELPMGSSFGLNNQTFDSKYGASFYAGGTAGVSVLALLRGPFGLGNDAYLVGGNTTDEGGAQGLFTQDGTLYAELPAGATAVAFTLGDSGVNIPLYVDAINAAGDHIQKVTFSGVGAPGAFIGFISDSPISEIRITGHASDLTPGDSTNVLLDNFRFGTSASAPAAVAPLPATAGAGGVLLLLIGATNARRRRRTPGLAA